MFLFSTANRWVGVKKKEVTYLVLTFVLWACVCLQVSYTQISVPTIPCCSKTVLRCSTIGLSQVLEIVLQGPLTSACVWVQHFASSVQASAQINQDFSICSVKEKPESVVVVVDFKGPVLLV